MALYYTTIRADMGAVLDRPQCPQTALLLVQMSQHKYLAGNSVAHQKMVNCRALHGYKDNLIQLICLTER